MGLAAARIHTLNPAVDTQQSAPNVSSQAAGPWRTAKIPCLRLLKRHGSRLALLLLLLWLMLVGAALWQKAQAAVQPPAYDAATYFQKAKSVWTGLRARPM